MFKHQGMWLPDGEKHFPEWMDRSGELVDGIGTYQIKKYRAALAHMAYPKLRVAVDVGAHVGFWALQMLKNFDIVHCFEPVAAYRECFANNLPLGPGKGDRADWFLYPYALGAQRGQVAMRIPILGQGIDSGGTHVVTAMAQGERLPVAGDVEMRTLDEFDFHDVDFLKIDVEGFELEVLKGARETLERCRPCVIVEQKPHKLGPNFGIKGTPAVDFLKAMGAEVRREMSGDYIMAWPS